MSEGIFVKNTTKPSDVLVKVFVRADRWYYFDAKKSIIKTSNLFKGNEHLSLAAPIMLGKFSDD